MWPHAACHDLLAFLPHYLHLALLSDSSTVLQAAPLHLCAQCTCALLQAAAACPTCQLMPFTLHSHCCHQQHCMHCCPHSNTCPCLQLQQLSLEAQPLRQRPRVRTTSPGSSTQPTPFHLAQVGATPHCLPAGVKRWEPVTQALARKLAPSRAGRSSPAAACSCTAACPAINLPSHTVIASLYVWLAGQTALFS